MEDENWMKIMGRPLQIKYISKYKLELSYRPHNWKKKKTTKILQLHILPCAKIEIINKRYFHRISPIYACWYSTAYFFNLFLLWFFVWPRLPNFPAFCKCLLLLTYINILKNNWNLIYFSCYSYCGYIRSRPCQVYWRQRVISTNYSQSQSSIRIIQYRWFNKKYLLQGNRG